MKLKAYKFMHGNTKLSPELREKIEYRYHLQMLPLSAIAIEFSVSLVTVRNFMLRNGIKIRTLSEANKLSTNMPAVKAKRIASMKGKPSGALGKRWCVQDTTRYKKHGAAHNNWKGGLSKNIEHCKQQRINAKTVRRNKTHVPAWADKAKIAGIYKESREKGLTVDHIIPLNNKLVTGLHCEANLQLLTMVENRKKGNRFASVY